MLQWWNGDCFVGRLDVIIFTAGLKSDPGTFAVFTARICSFRLEADWGGLEMQFGGYLESRHCYILTSWVSQPFLLWLYWTNRVRSWSISICNFLKRADALCNCKKEVNWTELFELWNMDENGWSRLVTQRYIHDIHEKGKDIIWKVIERRTENVALDTSRGFWDDDLRNCFRPSWVCNGTVVPGHGVVVVSHGLAWLVVRETELIRSDTHGMRGSLIPASSSGFLRIPRAFWSSCGVILLLDLKLVSAEFWIDWGARCEIWKPRMATAKIVGDFCILQLKAELAGSKKHMAIEGNFMALCNKDL